MKSAKRARQYKCGACSEEGHNARNCRKRTSQPNPQELEASGEELKVHMIKQETHVFGSHSPVSSTIAAGALNDPTEPDVIEPGVPANYPRTPSNIANARAVEVAASSLMPPPPDTQFKRPATKANVWDPKLTDEVDKATTAAEGLFMALGNRISQARDEDEFETYMRDFTTAIENLERVSDVAVRYKGVLKELESRNRVEASDPSTRRSASYQRGSQGRERGHLVF